MESCISPRSQDSVRFRSYFDTTDPGSQAKPSRFEERISFRLNMTNAAKFQIAVYQLVLASSSVAPDGPRIAVAPTLILCYFHLDLFLYLPFMLIPCLTIYYDLVDPISLSPML